MTNDTEYWQRQANRLYDRVLADVRIIAQNRRYIEDHVTLLKAKNMHPRSVIRHIYGILKLMEALGYDKDLKVVTKRDMEKTSGWKRGRGYTTFMITKENLILRMAGDAG